VRDGALLDRFRQTRTAALLRTIRHAYRATSRTLRVPEASEHLLARTRAWLGHDKPRVSVVVPTVGRATLQDAVDSAAWADEVIVVYDDAGIPADPPDRAVVYARGPTHHWGAEQRQLGIARATGTHLAFIDDDDVYTRDAGRLIMRALRARPARVHVFKMRDGNREYGGHGCVWDGGIGSPMFVVPNDERLGEWSTRYQGDYDFIYSTLAKHRRRPRFHEEVIAEIRPHRGHRP
jgi:glycosyltransferase involved in cell wall biosynthesis